MELLIHTVNVHFKHTLFFMKYIYPWILSLCQICILTQPYMLHINQDPIQLTSF